MAFSGKMTMINTIVRAVNRNPLILRQIAWRIIVGYGTICKSAVGSQPGGRTPEFNKMPTCQRTLVKPQAVHFKV